MTGFLPRYLRALALTWLIAGLILPPVAGDAHAAAIAASSHGVDRHAVPCDPPCDGMAGHGKPADASHHPDCCAAGSCVVSLALPATGFLAAELSACRIAYAPRVAHDPDGVDALPATDPPRSI